MTEAICKIMKVRHISRADLAAKLGKPRAWVTKILRGDAEMTLKAITDIFWVLGYTVHTTVEIRSAGSYRIPGVN